MATTIPSIPYSEFFPCHYNKGVLQPTIEQLLLALMHTVTQQWVQCSNKYPTRLAGSRNSMGSHHHPRLTYPSRSFDHDCSLVRVPEVLEKLRDVVAEHVVHRLDHLGLHLLELVNAVPAQCFSEVLHVREISCGEMMFPLHLFQQTPVIFRQSANHTQLLLPPL